MGLGLGVDLGLGLGLDLGLDLGLGLGLIWVPPRMRRLGLRQPTAILLMRGCLETQVRTMRFVPPWVATLMPPLW